MCPRRTLALGLEATAMLGLLARAATAAPHFDCRPGTVAFETVHLPDRNVVLLRQGPGCPVVAPKPPSPSGMASEDAAKAEGPALVDDASGGVLLSPSSALRGGSMQERSAGRERGPALTSAAAIAGVLTLTVLLVAISRTIWERSVHKPRLLAQKAAEEEAEAARLASEEAERRAREEELEQRARTEAERTAREEAEQMARQEAAALAQRTLQEQEEAIEASATGKSSDTPKNRCRDDDHTSTYQLARQEEEERRLQQEKDKVHKKEQPAGETKPEKKGRRGPCGCSSGKGAAEPGLK